MPHRIYRLSIHLGPLRVVSNSSIYNIKAGGSTILPGLPYSLLTLLFGWWGFNWFRAIRESTEALGINFSGGEDITKSMSEKDYDDDTNYVWNNLLRASKESIKKDDLEIALSLHYEFYEKNPADIYSETQNAFLLSALDTMQVAGFNKTIIEDMFEALRMYEMREG